MIYTIYNMYMHTTAVHVQFVLDFDHAIWGTDLPITSDLELNM